LSEMTKSRADKPNSARHRLTDIWPILVLALFPLLASIRLRAPGAGYDEMLYTNAGLGSVDDWMVTERLFGRPFLSMSYIGAFKSWVALPYFRAFGFSIITARWLGIIIATAGLGVLIWSLVPFGRKPAALAALLLATNPSMIDLTRVDLGPNAIELALRCVGLAIIVRWTRRVPSRLAAATLAGVMALGTFNKLNFVWTVGALLIFALIGVPSLRRMPAQLGLIALGLVASLGLVVRNRVVYGETRGVSFPSIVGIGTRIRVLGQTVNGTWFRYFSAPGATPWARLLVIVPLLVVLPLVTWAAWRRQDRLVLGFVAAGVVGLAMQLLTQGAISGWHSFVVFPIIPLLAAAPGGLPTRWSRQAAAACFVVMLAGQALTVAWLTDHREDRLLPIFTMAIYDLAQHAHDEPEPVLLTDWGMKGYLQAANHRTARYIETFWDAPPPLCHNLVVVRSPGYNFMPNGRAIALAIGPMHLESTINQNGTPVFDLYRIDTCVN
jgi:hypothetical protein